MYRTFVWLMVVCTFCGALWAQDYRARLTGRVLDTSGSTVANATVEITAAATGEVAKTVSNSEGVYAFSFLAPGTYTLKASATGFKALVRENVLLQSAQVAGIDLQLELGTLTETVTVSGEAALLETQTASRGAVVNSRMAQELPLNARNPLMLGALLPASTFRGAAIWQQPFANGAIAEWSINGGLQSNNEFQIDGAPNNAQVGANNIAYVPIAENVQEVSIQTNSYDAAYGKTTGGIVNMTLKSGTNDFHATGWGFLRRTALNANSFQNNAIGAPKATQRVDQYGFQVDGPLYIPKLLSKNSERLRVFWLGSWENYVEDLPQPLRLSYPAMEMRGGDFSRLTNAAGAPITIFDPASGRDVNGTWTRSPFPGNRIPAERIHPVARAVTRFMPEPNATTTGVRYSTQNLLFPNYSALYEFYNLAARGDFIVGSKNRFYYRYAKNRFDEDRMTNGINNRPGTDGQQPFLRINHAHLWDWVGTLSPTLVVNVRLNGARYVEGGFGAANEGFDLTSLGLAAGLISQLPQPAYFGRWDFQNYNSLGRARNLNITNTYSLQGSVNKIWRTHSIKAGMDLRRTHYMVRNSGNPLYFFSGSTFTREAWNLGATEVNSGDGYASFLLGAPASGQSDFVVLPFFRLWYASPFIQDDWKITRRLTLNLGLRLDVNTPPDEKYGRINSGFDAALASPIRSQIPANMLAQYPQLANLSGGVRFAGVNGAPRRAANIDGNNWQPRIGFAYQLTNRVVMRGGFGLFFANPINNDFLQTVGFSTFTPLVTTGDDGRTPTQNLFNNPYPNGLAVPAGAGLGANTFLGRSFTWFNPDFRIPQTRQFSVGFQYQLSKTSTIDVSYVGSRIRDHQTWIRSNNPSNELFRRCDPMQGGRFSFCDELVDNPFRGIEAFRGTNLFSAARVSRYQMSRPFPQFEGDLPQGGRNDGRMWYNSAQVNYNLRLKEGLFVNANYVFSKQIERWGWMNEFTQTPQQSLYFLDRPHVFKFSTAYELPFGRGQRFLANSNGFVRRLVGGWTANAFFTRQSGEPADLPAGALRLRDSAREVDWKQHQVRGWGGCVLNMDLNGNITPMAYSIQRNGCSATDLSSYDWLIAPSNRYGNVRLSPSRDGQIRMKPQMNLDLSLNKMTNVTERLRFQFRAEAFNAMNNFNIPRGRFNANPADPNFGTIFPGFEWIGNGLPRSVQLGFKALW